MQIAVDYYNFEDWIPGDYNDEHDREAVTGVQFFCLRDLDYWHVSKIHGDCKDEPSNVFGWSGIHYCPYDTYAVGITFRGEGFIQKTKHKPFPDQTGINGIKMFCSDGTYITTDGGQWGSWKDYTHHLICPSDRRMCGISPGFYRHYTDKACRGHYGNCGFWDYVGLIYVDIACCKNVLQDRKRVADGNVPSKSAIVEAYKPYIGEWTMKCRPPSFYDMYPYRENASLAVLWPHSGGTNRIRYELANVPLPDRLPSS